MRLVCLMLCLTSTFGCATGSCRSQHGANTDIKPSEEVRVTEKIKIFKYDGSLQCQEGKQLSLEVMKKELEGIEVFSSESKSDGLMRIQVCGSPTGKANVYEVNKKDLQKCLDKGFKVWTFN